jgi:FtsP/CotA-like multicopper oxidase with cupredoxin domain
MQISKELSSGWMGGSVATHKGVRVDDVVDPVPRLDIAFAADNSGDWIRHCYATGHWGHGMMVVIRVS